MTIAEYLPQSQRPDLGVEAVMPAAPHSVEANRYPWVYASQEVPTTWVRMEDGTEFRYGSIIGLNNSVEKIAAVVPAEASKRAEESLFRALPLVLSGRAHPSVDKVANQYPNSGLLRVGQLGRDAARLIFSVDRDSETVPVVLRVGITPHKRQSELFATITANRTVRKPSGRFR